MRGWMAALSRASSPSAEIQVYARLLQHFQTMAIEGVKAFECFALLRQVQTAIGQHAINIKKCNFDALGLEQQLRRKV